MEEKKDATLLEFYGSNFLSLIPLAVFVVFCVLCFVVFKDFAMESVCMGGFVSLVIGSLFARKSSAYWDAVVKGMSSEMMNTLALILFIVGMFGKMMTRAGVAEGFVWLGDLMGLHGGLFTAFSFIVACIMSTATGTSIGTLFSAFPILYPSGILLGADPVLLAGAILGGAIFGDNVAPVSDTTIASASSQTYKYRKGCADIGGVVATRMKYALVAAAFALICFAVFGGAEGGETSVAADEILAHYSDPRGLIMLIPVVILLIIAVKTQNIFLSVLQFVLVIKLLFNEKNLLFIKTLCHILTVTGNHWYGIALRRNRRTTIPAYGFAVMVRMRRSNCIMPLTG